MTYVPIKPDAGPSPKIDAPTIQGNFASFAGIFSSSAAGITYNHTALNQASQGNHQAVLMEKQTVDPEVTEDLAVLYCKDATSNAGTQLQLFARIQQFLPTIANTPMQLTYNQVNVAGPVYQSFLAGGYLIYFGTTMNVAVPITLSPAPTNLLVAIACPYTTTLPTNASLDVRTNRLNNFQFQIISTLASGVYTFGWVAIGTV